MSTTEITVSASNARPTSTDVTGGIDVDVVVTLPSGRAIEGEVTLAPSDHDGKPAAFGASPDEWVSDDLLKAIEDECGDGFRRALDEIEAVAASVAR